MTSQPTWATKKRLLAQFRYSAWNMILENDTNDTTVENISWLSNATGDRRPWFSCVYKGTGGEYIQVPWTTHSKNARGIKLIVCSRVDAKKRLPRIMNPEMRVTMTKQAPLARIGNALLVSWLERAAITIDW